MEGRKLVQEKHLPHHRQELNISNPCLSSLILNTVNKGGDYLPWSFIPTSNYTQKYFFKKKHTPRICLWANEFKCIYSLVNLCRIAP